MTSRWSRAPKRKRSKRWKRVVNFPLEWSQLIRFSNTLHAAQAHCGLPLRMSATIWQANKRTKSQQRLPCVLTPPQTPPTFEWNIWYHRRKKNHKWMLSRACSFVLVRVHSTSAFWTGFRCVCFTLKVGSVQIRNTITSVCWWLWMCLLGRVEIKFVLPPADQEGICR